MKVGCCGMEKFDNRPFNSVGSSRIRIRWLLPYWPEAEEFIIGQKYDALIYQKVYWGNMMDAFKGVQILDLCDPDWLENKPVFEFIDKVDAVTTSTQALADYIKKLRPNAFVQCVPDRVYLPDSVPIKKKHIGQIKKVVWFGYSQNSHYLHNTFDELITRGIELTAISNQTLEIPFSYGNKLKVKNVPYSYEGLNKEMVLNDAVLLPAPHGDRRAQYKSNNKIIHSWSIGLPVIQVPQDIDKFNDPDVRQKEADKNLKEIKDKWDVKQSVVELKNIIRKINLKKGVNNK